MALTRTQLIRVLVSLAAVAVIIAAITIAVIAGSGLSTGENGREIPKPHCTAHGNVPVFIRPGCD